MQNTAYEVVVELTRGPLIESIHVGAIAVSDARGNLVAHYGDPHLVANLRSSAKPFQALPLIERDGASIFGMSEREIAITCASHMGTDTHVAVLRDLQAKIGINESYLQCGIHPPGHEPTLIAMRERNETPTPNRHNCSGKHTGMLAQAVLRNLPLDDYLSTTHEIQRTILHTFSAVLGIAPGEVLIGIDGCSAPTFATPLERAALGFARLADPFTAINELGEKRAAALKLICHAMMTNPDMVSGPGGFDTALMEIGEGKIVCKSGAEGYQGIGVLPGAIGPGSAALGITYKVADGDQAGRARPIVGVEILRQLGALNETQCQALSSFATRPLNNWRGLEVGVIRPTFTLKR